MSNLLEEKNRNVQLAGVRVKNRKEYEQKLRKTSKNLDKIVNEGSCKKEKKLSKAKKQEVTSSRSKKLKLKPSPEQLEIISVKKDNGQVTIEFRAPPNTSATSISGTNQNEFTENKVEHDKIEFVATSISVQSILTERQNHQTVHGGSTATKDEMEFCVQCSPALSLAGNDDKEFSEIKVEDEIEFGEPSITVQSIPTYDAEPHKYRTIQDELTEVEDELEFCDEVEIDAKVPDKPGDLEGNKNKSELICDICSEQYSTKANLSLHHRKVHNTKPIYFQCDICSKQSSTKHNLKEHRRRHGKRNFRCTVCGVAKFTQNDIDSHMETHNTNRIYFTCDICPNKYLTKSNLSLHHRKVHDTKPIYFTCDLCSKQFSTKQTLKEHRRRHGKRNFCCTVCGLAKFTQYEINKHMKTHDTNRVYFRCNLCSNRYSTNGNLVAHMKTHNTVS